MRRRAQIDETDACLFLPKTLVIVKRFLFFISFDQLYSAQRTLLFCSLPRTVQTPVHIKIQGANIYNVSESKKVPLCPPISLQNVPKNTGRKETLEK